MRVAARRARQAKEFKSVSHQPRHRKRARFEEENLSLVDGGSFVSSIRSHTDLCCLRHLFQLPRCDMVKIAVDRDALWNERMGPDGPDIVDYRCARIVEFEPIDLPSSR